MKRNLNFSRKYIKKTKFSINVTISQIKFVKSKNHPKSFKMYPFSLTAYKIVFLLTILH